MEIPDWLQQRLHDKCPYCGSPIKNNEALTDRYCSNPSCPGHMAYKISALATRFGAKGFGPATCLELIHTFEYPYHVMYLPIMLPAPPKLYLWQVGEIAMIKGHQKRWKEYAAGCDTMKQVCAKLTTPPEIKQSLPLLQAAEAVCDIIPRLHGAVVPVMLTGSFDGYRSRSDFITDMNKKYGHLFQLVDVGKRKTGVQYLIKEPWTSDHEKSAIAQSYGIPIISPADMEQILKDGCAYITEGGGD